MKIAVIGYTGMVGKQCYKYFKQQGYKVMGWTPTDKTHTWKQINKLAEYIFITVPTPYDWKDKKATYPYDLTALENTLKKIKGNKKVIIKSTITPNTTQVFQERFKNLYLMFNPEFLSNATAWQDFINPDRQIIGYTKKSYKYAIESLNLLPESPYSVIMTSTEAEIVKFVNNFHGSLMVIFANFFYDICQKTNSNFEKVKKASQASKWVGSPMGRMYWDIFKGGYRGYGNKCFPKDMNALLKWCKYHGINTEILEATKNANIKLLEYQGLTEEKVEREK
jgi:UDPglucose 6-dehydrogenase